MIQELASAASFLAAICSAFAAYHWYQAAQVKDPPSALAASTGWAGRGQSTPSGGADASPVVKYTKESSAKNRTAALWSMAAAAFAGLAWAFGLFIPHG